MNQIRLNWSWRRAIRLFLGLLIIFQGIQTKEWIFVVLGIVFTGLALFNKTMCGIGQACEMETKKENSNEDIVYEEVK